MISTQRRASMCAARVLLRAATFSAGVAALQIADLNERCSCCACCLLRLCLPLICVSMCRYDAAGAVSELAYTDNYHDRQDAYCHTVSGGRSAVTTRITNMQ